MKYHWTLKSWLTWVKIKIALREQKEHSKSEVKNEP